MKTITFFLLLTLANFSFAQTEFYIDGQLVDQTVVQEVELVEQSPVLEHTEFWFKNVSNNTVSWKMDHCMLVDHQNIVGVDVEWYTPNYPFGEHFIFGPTSLDTCWEMPNSLETELLPGEHQRVRPGLESFGSGCELHRFYVVENGVAIDSIDIQYCSTLSINENELGFEISPNPANSNLTIETLALINKVQILDLNGREVFTQDFLGESSVMLNCEAINDGFYMVIVSFENQASIERRISIVH